jgi:hypothetical protein
VLHALPSGFHFLAGVEGTGATLLSSSLLSADGVLKRFGVSAGRAQDVTGNLALCNISWS